MLSLKTLSKTTIAKGHHVLLDIELARMHGADEEQLRKLHTKFYSIIPHNNTHPILSENSVYVKRALLMAAIKDYK
jgi:hypothetical protein